MLNVRILQLLTAGVVLSLGAWLLVGSTRVPDLTLSFSERPMVGLRSEPQEFDFGEVSEGVHTGSFDLINTNKQESILVHRVITSCSCDEIIVPEKIGPSEKVNIPVRWNVTGRNGVAWNDFVVVWANESEPRTLFNLKCRLRASVDPDFVTSTESETLYVGTAKNSVEIELLPRRLSDARITDAHVFHPALQVAMINQNRVRVEMVAGADDLIRDDSAVLVIATNSPHRSNFEFPIFLRRGAVASNDSE
jgi:hypothetical protein